MKASKAVHTFAHPVHGTYWYTEAKLCKAFHLEPVELSKLVTGTVQSYQNWRVVTK